MVGGEILLDLPQNLDAVDAGQHDVEQCQVGLLPRRDFSASSPYWREDFIALALQRAADGAQRQRLVIDNQDGVRHS